MSCNLTTNIEDIYKIVKFKLMEYDYNSYQSSILHVECPILTWDYKSMFIGFNRETNEHKMILRFWKYSNFIESAKIGIYKPAFVRIGEDQILLKPKEIDKIKNFIGSLKSLNDKVESDDAIVLDGVDNLLNVVSENHLSEYKWNNLKPEWNIIGSFLEYLNEVIKEN